MEAYEVLCLANFLGRPDRTMEYADTAIRLSPRDPYISVRMSSRLAVAFFIASRTITRSNGSVVRPPQGPNPSPICCLPRRMRESGRYGRSGKTNSNVIFRSKAQEHDHRPTEKGSRRWLIIGRGRAYNERLFEGLRKVNKLEE